MAQNSGAKKVNFSRKAKFGNATTGKSTKLPFNKSGSEIAIGTSFNLYSSILHGQNQVAYNPDINTIIFIHRQNAGGTGGSGVLTYDISKDGGITWSTNQGPLTPAIQAGTAISDGCRYPSATIWNPVGNTNPNNAYIVGTGPALTKPSQNWGLIFNISQKLDGTNNNETYFSNTTNKTDFHPYSLCNANGKLFSISTTFNSTGNSAQDTLDYHTFYINKGVFNTTTNSVDWSVVDSISPNFYKIDSNSVNLVTDWNLAFSPNGKIAYAIIIGAVQGRNSVPKPYVYESTDSGSTWNLLPNFNFSTLQTMQDNIEPTPTDSLIRPYFNAIDAVVDSSNTLHLFTYMNSGLTSDSDSLNYVRSYIGTQFLMDVSYNPNNSEWNATLVDTIACASGTIADSLDTIETYYYPQASRTADGSRIFFTWQMTAPSVSHYNIAPDVYAQMYDASNQSYTAIKQLTNSHNVFFPTVSPIVISGGSNFDYEIPIVYAVPDSANPVSGSPQYYYLKGAGINDGYNGIDEIKKKATIINLFPNPNNGILHIWLSSNERAKAIVYNIVGKEINEFNLNSKKSTINLNNLTEGIYFVKVIQGNTVDTKKVVITK